jgi:hypothetical protein
VPSAATQFFSFPTTVLQAGNTYGPQVTGAIGSVASVYQVSIQQMGVWPVGDCLRVHIDYSQDGGQSWRSDLVATFTGGVWKDRQGTTVTSASLGVQMGVLNPGGPAAVILATALTDLFRVTVECLQSCSAIVKMGYPP